MKPKLEDIRIRNKLVPGDLGYVVYMHGRLYSEEYRYGVEFESYVAEGLSEFYRRFDAAKDRVWVCEHRDKIIGFLLLMHREHREAQLRYFLVEPAYRGIGLGKKLMNLYMEFLKERGYALSYLWTTHELDAAAGLYRKHGFVLTQEKDSNAFGKELKEQRYDWRVGGGEPENRYSV